MVNGNYVLYGDRPSSESEIVDDHVHVRTDRKIKRKNHRSANELQHTLNLAQLDNDTDSVKYEKKIKEPRLLRYVPTTDVEENFVTEKFETYDLKPTEERPRRYAFTKKPKNPADGSVNYAYSVYSRSSSTCSSPNANLPTISEHGEQYGTHRVRAMPSPTVNDLIPGYDTKLDKYFSKPREVKPFAAKINHTGSHPDSLYVTTETNVGGKKLTRVLRVLRWPIALVTVCIALAVFVYFLMPDNLESGSGQNKTYWEPMAAGVGLRGKAGQKEPIKDGTDKLGTKPTEIDFYAAENDKKIDLTSVIDVATGTKRPPPIPPVFPTHLTPEVQYGNEKADSEKRTPKLLEDVSLADSTLKPHITQKPEKPLAIYFEDVNDATTATTETITRSETTNNFTNSDQKQTNKNVEEFPVKTHPSAYKEYVVPVPKDFIPHTEHEISEDYEINRDSAYPSELQDYYNRASSAVDVNFTSGHSKLFGISIEDAERMKSTTQSALYNTRVSPTLPTWRDRDDTTTKNYPTNIYSDVQCHSTHLALCRGVLPYDLAGAAVKVGKVEITSLMSQIEYVVAANCSERVRQFVCAMLEPECSPPPYPPKMPCYNLCKAVVDSCDGHIPRELIPAFKCGQYSNTNCVAAKSPCHEREFACGDGSCIPRDWKCDGNNDCSAGEDEQQCIQCDATEFKCSSGSCILRRWLCDGYKDCPKGEDESEGVCGPNVQPSIDVLGEPGEELAGSAPAPAVRRPNKVPTGHRKHSDVARHNENDSSKELLVTSYSNNALNMMRNFTPSPARLMPYNRTSNYRLSGKKQKKLESSVTEEKQEPPKTDSGKTNTDAKRVKGKDEEYIDDVNMGDLKFFDDFEKEEKPESRNSQWSGRRVYAPHPSPVTTGLPLDEPVIKETEPPTRLNMHADKPANFEKVIDGAALLKKASAAAAAEDAELEKEAKATNFDSEDEANGDYGTGKRNWSRAHASPCPSGELRCVDGHCITLAQLCDGTIDCSDHADEDNCYT